MVGIEESLDFNIETKKDDETAGSGILAEVLGD